MTDSTTTESTRDITAAHNLMQVLLKGLRAIQLYLPNNPIYQQAVINVRAAFAPVWEETDDLTLAVTDTAFLWEGKPVLAQDTKNESVAWVLYKDGIRALTFLPGVEDKEIVNFLACIQKVRTLQPDAEDDLLTLLWEQDFQTIRYSFVELGAEDAPPLTKPETPAEQAAPKNIREEVQQEVRPQTTTTTEAAPTATPGIVSLEDFDPTLYFLDDPEIEYLKGEIDREYQQDLRANVLAILFDLLELQTYITVRAELISILDNFIPYLLAVGDFRSVAYVLRELRVVLQRGREIQPEHRQAIEQLPGKLSQSDALSQLLQSLDESVVLPTEEDLTDLFRELRADSLGTLLEWLPRLTNQQVRELLDGAAQRLAQIYPAEVVKALGNPNESVLTETVRLVSRLKLPPVVPALGNLFSNPSATLRVTVAETLAAIGTAGALQQLEKGVDDSERDVRIVAIRTLGSRGQRSAFPKIEAAVLGKTLKDADLSEKMVVFEAYGMLAGAAGIERLSPMLAVGGFMKRKEDPETRACAAMALGKIGTPEVRKILEQAAADKDPVVRNAVNKALRELR